MASDGSSGGEDGPAPYAEHLRNVLQNGVLGGVLPTVTTNPNWLQDQAEKKMTKKGFYYILGGAGEGSTVDANRLAFRQWKIIPRVLKPTTRDLSVTLFGKKYSTSAEPKNLQSERGSTTYYSG